MNTNTTTMTARKFANMVARDLGWSINHISTGEAGRYADTAIRHEVDGTFYIVGLPAWVEVKLMELGYTATARIKQPEWSGAKPVVVLYWSK